MAESIEAKIAHVEVAAFFQESEGSGEIAPTALEAIEQNYALGVTDEFVLPTVLGGYEGMKAEDGVLMFNFRADRARQILTAITDPEFAEFSRKTGSISTTVGLTEYSINDVL